MLLHTRSPAWWSGQGWKVGEAECPITAQAIKDEELVCGQRWRGKPSQACRQWALTRSLIASQARPTLPSVMSRGPDYGVNYSYPVGWERWGDREEGLKLHRILQFCHSLWWFFVALLPPFTQLNLGPSLVWMECNFKRHIWVATHSSDHPAAAALATQSFSGLTITVLKGQTLIVNTLQLFPCTVIMHTGDYAGSVIKENYSTWGASVSNIAPVCLSYTWIMFLN